MHNKHTQLILVIAGSLTAIVGIFTFVQNRTKNKLETEIAHLDKHIKQLELHDRLTDRNS